MRQCLICKRRIIEHYGICPDCTEMNRVHRMRHEDMTGYTALVTGGRINIGYGICLRLLRDGASVIAVTRFPYDALRRYSAEPDFNDFRDRLFICGFDLKRIDCINILLDYVKNTFPDGLDILINNAAQTIRKAPSYYNELATEEEKLRLEYGDSAPIVISETESGGFQLFPMTDTADLTAYETPDHNSWVSKADEISPAEMLEVQLINVTAPFLLTGQLKAHMKKSGKPNKFIINVSSVEGRFNHKTKLARHVHTNMAKASLNMMTHSLASEYAADRIFIYSVDPGWISNQFPVNYQVSKAFSPYLDFDDGAARICFPIYEHLHDKTKPKDAGALYKDYKIMEY